MHVIEAAPLVAACHLTAIPGRTRDTAPLMHDRRGCVGGHAAFCADMHSTGSDETGPGRLYVAMNSRARRMVRMVMFVPARNRKTNLPSFIARTPNVVAVMRSAVRNASTSARRSFCGSIAGKA